LSHPEWKQGVIKVFAMFPESEAEEQQEKLLTLIRTGRVPIAPQNVEFVPHAQDFDRKEIANSRSADADLAIFGFNVPHFKRSGAKILSGLDKLGNVLFVTTSHEIELTDEEPPSEKEDSNEVQVEENSTAPNSSQSALGEQG
jgi:hypothetical protein